MKTYSRFLLIVLTAVTLTSTLSAQTGATGASGAAGPAGATGASGGTAAGQQNQNRQPQNAGPVELKMDNAVCLDQLAKPKSVCGLGDVLMLHFPNLKDWIKDPAAAGKNKTDDLVLVLNGRVMKGLKPIGPCTDDDKVPFQLNRLNQADNDNRDAWSAILSKAKQDIALSVAVALNGAAPCCGGPSIRFGVFGPYSWIVAVFMLVLLTGFILLAWKSDLLRDGPDIVIDGTKERRTYSLGRVQMAWWFFIVLSTFDYIWLVLGDSNSLTQGALILIGISTATGLGAVIVENMSPRPALEKQREDLTSKIGAAPPPANLADLQRQLDDVNAQLAKLPKPQKSEGILTDILSDDTGVSFHRFQMAAWTVVLGFVFITTVFGSLAMPDFSPTLLGLMGISSGTYIGFKIPEQTKTTT